MKKRFMGLLMALAMLTSAIPVGFAENTAAEINVNEEAVVIEEEIFEVEEDSFALPEAVGEIEVFEEETVEEVEVPEEEAVVFEDAVTVTYPIEKDQTFSFENIDIVEHEITGLSNNVDYVIYYKDGSVKAYDDGTRLNTVVIPAGGKIVMTSINNTINAVLADDYFIVEEMTLR